MCCSTALRKATRRVTQLYDEALAPVGLRSTQYSILMELSRRASEAPSLKVLADALVMDRSAWATPCAHWNAMACWHCSMASRTAASGRSC